MMQSTAHYSRSADRTNGTLANFHRMSNDDPLEKADACLAPTHPHLQHLFNCFAFFGPRDTAKDAKQVGRLDIEKRTPTPSAIAALSFASMESRVDAVPYAWPSSGGIDPNTTALVIIDMQNDCESSLAILTLLVVG